MKDTVLLVIDTQKGITDSRLFEFEKLVKNIKILIDAARKNSVEVIFVQHDDGPGSGFSVGDEDFEIFEGFKPKENEKIFVKTVNSALHKSVGLSDYLLKNGVTKILTVGLQTNFCIDATLHTGFDLGFEMLVPEYTNSTFKSEYMSAETAYRYYNEFLWNGRFAKCISMDEATKLLESKD
ncbi:isochorismatase family protein [Treponema zioleckii]|uniref:isochorismatase family protein n=1 Tax=Treponema zioleckii TaxID=331680 RepID=UPI00168A4672|nr:isochorismatase family protein [Treponema zioleckii]